MRNAVNNVKLFDRNLVDLVENVYARNIDPEEGGTKDVKT